jgi:hypothetical protein
LRKETDLSVKLRLRYSRVVPSVILTSVLELLEREIYEVEISSLTAACALFPEMPRPQVCAVADHLRNNRRRTLLLVGASNGSMVISGLVCAVGIWVLNETLGETLRTAWKRSPLHSKLVDFLSSERPRRISELKKRLSTELRRERDRLRLDGIQRIGDSSWNSASDK